MTVHRSFIRSALLRFCRDDRGATAVEYGLIIAMVVITMIVALKEVASATSSVWNNVGDKVTQVSPSS